MVPVKTREIELIKRLVDRLEHLSVDSIYSHRASGLRGSLLHWVEQLELGKPVGREQRKQLDQLVEDAFHILELAAKEMGGPG